MEFAMKYFKMDKKSKIEKEKKNILEYLFKLKAIEARFWGVILKDIDHFEELIVEDTNHLIYLISKNNVSKIKNIIKTTEFEKIIKDIDNLKTDFKLLKKEIREKEKLKLLISNFTIKLIDSKNYSKFKNVFLLEKMLNEVIDKQDFEFMKMGDDITKIKVHAQENNIEDLIKYLKEIRKILSGHIEHHSLFEEERMGYSNTSNIIHELIKLFKQDID